MKITQSHHQLGLRNKRWKIKAN
uniref:Uncharacterized protein n=1 Tax=Arundo donax TaxID=35708 RepID=A0A0A9CHS3_ARUDO